MMTEHGVKRDRKTGWAKNKETGVGGVRETKWGHKNQSNGREINTERNLVGEKGRKSDAVCAALCSAMCC